MPQDALTTLGSNWEELDKKLSFKGPIYKLFMKVKDKLTESDDGKVFFTDPGDTVGKKTTMKELVFFDPKKVGHWLPIGFAHLKNTQLRTIEKLVIPQGGKSMNSTDLPKGGSITVGEKFWIDKIKFLKATKGRRDADKIERMINNFGSGPFFLFEILYFYQKRSKYFFLRFKNINEEEQWVNIKYCSKYEN